MKDIKNLIYSTLNGAHGTIEAFQSSNRTFEKTVIEVYESILEFCRIVPRISIDDADKIFLNPANGISYRTLKTIACKLITGSDITGEDWDDYNIMKVAYESGALVNEHYKLSVILKCLIHPEQRNEFNELFNTVYNMDTYTFGKELCEIIRVFDSYDEKINEYMRALELISSYKDIRVDIVHEFKQFKNYGLLNRFFFTNASEFGLINLFSIMREMAAMVPYIDEFVQNHGKIDSSIVNFITDIVIAGTGIDLADFYMNIRGMSTINRILRSSAEKYLVNKRYNVYLGEVCVNATTFYGRTVTREALSAYHKMIYDTNKPFVTRVYETYDDANYSDHFTICGHTRKQINDIVDCILGVLYVHTTAVQSTLSNLLNTDVRSYFGLVNKCADILQLQNELENCRITTPLKALVDSNDNLIGIINDPAKQLDFVNNEKHISIDTIMDKLIVFISEFTKLDLGKYVGDESTEQQKEEYASIPTNDDITLGLQDIMAVDPRLDYNSNSLLILSNYLPPRHAFIRESVFNIPIILDKMTWRDQYAKAELFEVMKEVLYTDNIMTTKFTEFIAFSCNVADLVHMIAGRYPHKNEDDVREIILKKFEVYITEQDLAFVETYNVEIITDIIRKEIFLQFGRDTEGKIRINCCVLLASLLNSKINKNYRYGLLYSRIDMARSLYDFIVHNMVEISNDLT